MNSKRGTAGSCRKSHKLRGQSRICAVGPRRKLSDRSILEGDLGSCMEVQGQGSCNFFRVHHLERFRRCGRKGKFIINLSVQSKHWSRGAVKMETLPEFAVSIITGDHMMSMDIVKGYRLLRLHLAKREWFIFRYEGEYDQCFALLLRCGLSRLSFTQTMSIFVRELRSYGYRVLAYVEYFPIIPSLFGITEIPEHCGAACHRIDVLMDLLGLQWHPDKGCWKGAQVVEHLGVTIDTVQIKLFLLQQKHKKIQSITRKILLQIRFGR